MAEKPSRDLNPSMRGSHPELARRPVGQQQKGTTMSKTPATLAEQEAALKAQLETVAHALREQDEARTEAEQKAAVEAANLFLEVGRSELQSVEDAALANLQEVIEPDGPLSIESVFVAWVKATEAETMRRAAHDAAMTVLDRFQPIDSPRFRVGRHEKEQQQFTFIEFPSATGIQPPTFAGFLDSVLRGRHSAAIRNARALVDDHVHAAMEAAAEPHQK